MTETTELTLTDRARQALSFSTTADKLKELAAKSSSITEVTNKAGRDQAHRAAMDLRDARLAIQRTGKEAREDARKFADAVVSAEKELVALVEPEEDRLKALRDEWDDARQREREEEERKERERVQAMVDGIASMTAWPSRFFGATVKELDRAIELAGEWDLSAYDDVYSPNAKKAQDDAIATLKEARDKRQALDDEAAAVAAAHEAQRLEREAAEAKLAAERKAFEAEQAAAREKQAELDRQAAEARAEADRAAQAERDRQAAELAERQRELDEQAAEQRRQAEEAAQRAQEEQEARDRAAAEEQAAKDAQAAQERAEREADAIRTATLYDAASEALPLLVDAYGHENLTAKKLASALAREPQG